MCSLYIYQYALPIITIMALWQLRSLSSIYMCMQLYSTKGINDVKLKEIKFVLLKLRTCNSKSKLWKNRVKRKGVLVCIFFVGCGSMHRQYYLGVGCWGSGIHEEGGIPYTPIQVDLDWCAWYTPLPMDPTPQTSNTQIILPVDQCSM